MEFNLMSILTLVIGFFVGFLIVVIFMAIRNNQNESKANKLIEDAKKEADKHKRDTLMEIRSLFYHKILALFYPLQEHYLLHNIFQNKIIYFYLIASLQSY